jgi:hypothetical protein
LQMAEVADRPASFSFVRCLPPDAAGPDELGAAECELG